MFANLAGALLNSVGGTEGTPREGLSGWARLGAHLTQVRLSALS
jgi:hypothetical protein